MRGSCVFCFPLGSSSHSNSGDIEMDEFERFLKKFETDGFEFQSKQTDWGQRYVGTKKPGDSASITGFLAKALGLPHKMMGMSSGLWPD